MTRWLRGWGDGGRTPPRQLGAPASLAEPRGHRPLGRPHRRGHARRGRRGPAHVVIVRSLPGEHPESRRAGVRTGHRPTGGRRGFGRSPALPRSVTRVSWRSSARTATSLPSAGPSTTLFRDVYRLRIVEGRAPAADAPEEVVIGEPLARSSGLGPGDTLRLQSFTQDQVDELDPNATELPAPAGPEVTLRVVGVSRSRSTSACRGRTEASCSCRARSSTSTAPGSATSRGRPVACSSSDSPTVRQVFPASSTICAACSVSERSMSIPWPSASAGSRTRSTCWPSASSHSAPSRASQVSSRWRSSSAGRRRCWAPVSPQSATSGCLDRCARSRSRGRCCSRSLRGCSQQCSVHGPPRR